MFDGSSEPYVDTLVDDIPHISGRGIPARTVAPTQPPLRALLARLEIEPIPDEVVTAHKREQIAAAGGSDIRFALAWFTNNALNLTAWALIIFCVSTFFIATAGVVVDRTWVYLLLPTLIAAAALVVVVVVALALEDITVRPRARWREVPYEQFYPYQVPDMVRGQVLLLRIRALEFDLGLDITILELRQAEVRLDPIAVVASGGERYAFAIWG